MKKKITETKVIEYPRWDGPWATDGVNARPHLKFNEEGIILLHFTNNENKSQVWHGIMESDTWKSTVLGSDLQAVCHYPMLLRLMHDLLHHPTSFTSRGGTDLSNLTQKTQKSFTS